MHNLKRKFKQFKSGMMKYCNCLIVTRLYAYRDIVSHFSLDKFFELITIVKGDSVEDSRKTGEVEFFKA